MPARDADFHLNALQFLEVTPCQNCLSVSNLKKLGGGVIEIDVTIHHPFPNQLIYSAFDVKGIIMFNGTLKTTIYELWAQYPELHGKMLLSWAHLGDWELLNPDGDSYFWSPIFNPNSQWPITQYLPGKHSSGAPSGTINGFINFYTDEERHLFRAGHSVTKTYRIQTQPGALTVGYAIDACWEPPINKPVTNPLTDFPPTANQPEPYQFSVVVNDGQPLHQPLCPDLYPDSSLVKLIVHQWNGQTVTKQTAMLEYEHPDQLHEPQNYDCLDNDQPLIDCDPPCGDGCYCGICGFDGTQNPLYGWFCLVVDTYWGSGGDYHDLAVTKTDFHYGPS